jgi:hypothetical protein
MYGRGLAMYPKMPSFQVPLLQATAQPSKTKHEATITKKANFNKVGPSGKQKGELQQSTSHGTNKEVL